MSNSFPYNQIEEYLQGDLEGADLKAFELLLAQDKSFQQEVGFYKSIKRAVGDKDLNKLEVKLKSAETKYFNQSEPQEAKQRTISQRWIWRACAAVVIGLFVWGISSIISPDFSSKKLYAQYAKHDFSFQEKSTPNELAVIQALLKSSQYQQAIPLLDNYLVTNPNAAEIKLAKGIALIESNQNQAAISLFNELGKNHPLFQNEAYWYSALTYLRQDRLTESLTSLRKILENSSRYPDAKKVIDLLELQVK